MSMKRRPKPGLSAYPTWAPIATSRSAARRQTARMMDGSPAWAPQATLALVTTSSRALSSPIVQLPKPSPRSAFRSTVCIRSSSRHSRSPAEQVDDGEHRTHRQVAGEQPGRGADRQQPGRLSVPAEKILAPPCHPEKHTDPDREQQAFECAGEDQQRRRRGAEFLATDQKVTDTSVLPRRWASPTWTSRISASRWSPNQATCRCIGLAE